MRVEILLLISVLTEKFENVSNRILDSQITGIIMLAFVWAAVGAISVVSFF